MLKHGTTGLERAAQNANHLPALNICYRIAYCQKPVPTFWRGALAVQLAKEVPMAQFSVHDAKTNLSRLIAQTQAEAMVLSPIRRCSTALLSSIPGSQ